MGIPYSAHSWKSPDSATSLVLPKVLVTRQAHPPATDAASAAASDGSVTESGCGSGASEPAMSCPVTLPDPSWSYLFLIVSLIDQLFGILYGTFLQIFALHKFSTHSLPKAPKSIASPPSQMEPNLAFLVRAPAVAVPESEARCVTEWTCLHEDSS